MIDLGRRVYDPDEVVPLVGCGKQKREDGREHMAKALYTSSYFAQKRRLAEAASRWYILSAKHGLLAPSHPLGYYDRSMGDVAQAGETAAWGDRVVAALLCRWGEFADAGVAALALLAGSDYVDPLLDAFRRSDSFEAWGAPASPVAAAPDAACEGVRVGARGHDLRVETPLRGMPFHVQMSWLSHRSNHSLSTFMDSPQPSHDQ